MLRIPEPILMTDALQVTAYDQAHFEDSSLAYRNFLKPFLSNTSFTVLDIGCATGQLTLDVAQTYNHCSFIGIDGSLPMLALAQKNLMSRKLTNVKFEQHFVPSDTLQLEAFDFVLCKDFLHHLHQPQHLWQTLSQLPIGTPFVIVDLLRPNSKVSAQKMVKETLAVAPQVLKDDFYHSLLAAFTLEEVKAQLASYAFSYQIEKLGSRHFAVVGKV